MHTDNDMMDAVQDLYQEMILDHKKNPKNHRSMDGCTHHADGHNPLCGDRITVYLSLNNHRIDDVSFEGTACAICTASASMMTEAIKGKTEEQTNRLFRNFHSLVTSDQNQGASLGKLAAFEGVRQFPMRVKCATLAWHTLVAAISEGTKVVSTE
jgi:nitrogen fixation protein NifU and related proteins